MDQKETKSELPQSLGLEGSFFDENRFSSISGPSQRSLTNGTDDDEVVVWQPELRKSKRNRTLKSLGPNFQLYLIEGTMDKVFDKHSYCFNIKDEPKTFDEGMMSHDVAFWKEIVYVEMNSIMGNNTWVLADLPFGCKWIFKRKLMVDETIEKFKARLVM
nr:zinc finger, CCHC-type [Tanacetum cinerariifolium]